MNIEDNNSTNSKRIVFLDVLRIVACFAVVVIHVIGNEWYKGDPLSVEWNFLNILNSICRPAVPLFVMISGALLLNPEKHITIHDILTKYIRRMVIVFIFWSAFYAVVFTIYLHHGFLEGLRMFGTGTAHLWYIFMCIGLYLTIPILRLITKNLYYTQYFLLMGLVFTFIIPFIESCFHSEILSYDIKELNFHLAYGYTVYFVAGYFFYIIRLNNIYKNLIYIGGGIGLLSSITATTIFSQNGQVVSFTSYLHLFNMMMSLAIFLFFKNIKIFVNNKNKLLNVINIISKDTLGVYLLHPFIISVFHQLTKLEVKSFHCLVSVPIISISVFLFSCGITHAMRKIIILKKVL